MCNFWVITVNIYVQIQHVSTSKSQSFHSGLMNNLLWKPALTVDITTNLWVQANEWMNKICFNAQRVVLSSSKIQSAVALLEPNKPSLCASGLPADGVVKLAHINRLYGVLRKLLNNQHIQHEDTPAQRFRQRRPFRPQPSSAERRYLQILSDRAEKRRVR